MSDALRDLVAAYWKLDPASVRDDLTFDAVSIPGFSSLRFFRFLAAVESQMDVVIADPSAVVTVGALCAVTAGEPAPLVTRAPAPAPLAAAVPVPVRPPLRLAHALVAIDDVPDPADAAHASFVTRHFSEQDARDCRASADPRAAFAERLALQRAFAELQLPVTTPATVSTAHAAGIASAVVVVVP